MPVVPRMEMPPRIPKRGFMVFFASSSPPGTEISITTSASPPHASAACAIAVRIIARGTGFIAGSPTGTGKPGFVTVPTLRPRAKNNTVAAFAAPHRSRARALRASRRGRRLRL